MKFTNFSIKTKANANGNIITFSSVAAGANVNNTSASFANILYLMIAVSDRLVK